MVSDEAIVAVQGYHGLSEGTDLGRPRELPEDLGLQNSVPAGTPPICGHIELFHGNDLGTARGFQNIYQGRPFISGASKTEWRENTQGQERPELSPNPCRFFN